MAGLDVRALWDFSDPEGSERRFRSALMDARGDEALVLKTQVARTYGLRGRFEQARALLSEVEQRLVGSAPRTQAYYWLELGRTWCSAAHEEELSARDRDLARSCFEQALRVAHAGVEDDLAVDAVHMLAFVDTAPGDQLRWADTGLQIALASTSKQARSWEATLRNNRGVALGRLGRHAESLAEYERALALTRRTGDVTRTRIATWMVASALRQLGRLDEAEQLQRELQAANAADGTPDPYVDQELDAIARARRQA